MKITKKKVFLAVLCVIVFVICFYYFVTHNKNRSDEADKPQAEITMNLE